MNHAVPTADLAGRRIVVTGGASGIGLATVSELVRRGAVAVAIDRNPAVGEIAANVGAAGVVGNVASSDELGPAMDAAAEMLQGIDGVVANAGIGHLKPLEAYTDAEFDRIVDVNLKGAFLTLRESHRHLVVEGRASAVLVSSVTGHRPTLGEGPYSAAKAGVIALARSAAQEWAPSIRVNCVSPGFIATPLNQFVVDDDQLRGQVEAGTPLQRVGTAFEVASVIAFLLSDAASYVTGQDVIIDGGSVLPSAQVGELLATILGRSTQSSRL